MKIVDTGIEENGTWRNTRPAQQTGGITCAPAPPNTATHHPTTSPPHDARDGHPRRARVIDTMQSPAGTQRG